MPHSVHCKHAQAFAQLINSLSVTAHLRGFATNTAGYQPLGTVACPTFDWCGLMLKSKGPQTFSVCGVDVWRVVGNFQSVFC